MRTTLTIEPEIAERLRQELALGKRPLKTIVNAALKRGLGAVTVEDVTREMLNRPLIRSDVAAILAANARDIDAAKAAGIAGFEWMEGIPGSVGGGLRMNAGAMGSETMRQVVSVTVVDPAGRLQTRTPADLEIHYRDVPSFKVQFVTSAIFEGRPGVPAEIAARMEESMQKRRASQPKESSAGCIFKNPAACPAGKLIDELGLKDTRIGGARISDIHGNFIVNDRDATARDILALIDYVKAAARAQRGIELETEVQVVGEEEIRL